LKESNLTVPFNHPTSLSNSICSLLSECNDLKQTVKENTQLLPVLIQDLQVVPGNEIISSPLALSLIILESIEALRQDYDKAQTFKIEKSQVTYNDYTDCVKSLLRGVEFHVSSKRREIEFKFDLKDYMSAVRKESLSISLQRLLRPYSPSTSSSSSSSSQVINTSMVMSVKFTFRAIESFQTIQATLKATDGQVNWNEIVMLYV
jgi:hypothetical protein